MEAGLHRTEGTRGEQYQHNAITLDSSRATWWVARNGRSHPGPQLNDPLPCNITRIFPQTEYDTFMASTKDLEHELEDALERVGVRFSAAPAWLACFAGGVGV
jgi:hypothetical protein